MSEFYFEAEQKRLLDRIAELETALRAIHELSAMGADVVKALHARRQENSDVFPGFRGNNDAA
jgi:Mg2+ and Co2+ transporter CorA